MSPKPPEPLKPDPSNYGLTAAQVEKTDRLELYCNWAGCITGLPIASIVIYRIAPYVISKEGGTGLFGVGFGVILASVSLSIGFFYILFSLLGLISERWIAPRFSKRYTAIKKYELDMEEYERLSAERAKLVTAFQERERQEEWETRRKERELSEEQLRRKASFWLVLDGYEFERQVAKVFELHGFIAKVTRGSGDEGVDIVLLKGGQKGVVQCKAHGKAVSPGTIRDMYGAMHHFKANYAVVVSSNGFTGGSKTFASDKPVILLDVSDLIAIQDGQRTLDERIANLLDP